MFTLGDVADVLDGALDTGISIIDTLAKLSEIADEGNINRNKCFNRLQIDSDDINNNNNETQSSNNAGKIKKPSNRNTSILEDNNCGIDNDSNIDFSTKGYIYEDGNSGIDNDSNRDFNTENSDNLQAPHNADSMNNTSNVNVHQLSINPNDQPQIESNGEGKHGINATGSFNKQLDIDASVSLVTICSDGIESNKSHITFNENGKLKPASHIKNDVNTPSTIDKDIAQKSFFNDTQLQTVQRRSHESSVSVRKNLHRRTTFVLEQSPVKTIEEATAQGIPIIEALGDLCNVADDFLKDYTANKDSIEKSGVRTNTDSPQSPEDFDLLINSKVNEILSSFQKLDSTVDLLKKKALKENFSHLKHQKDIETLFPSQYRELLKDAQQSTTSSSDSASNLSTPKKRPGTYTLDENIETSLQVVDIDIDSQDPVTPSVTSPLDDIMESPFFKPQSDSMRILNKNLLSSSKRLPDLQVFPIDVDMDPIADDSKNNVDTGFNLSRCERPGTYVISSGSSSNENSPLRKHRTGGSTYSKLAASSNENSPLRMKPVRGGTFTKADKQSPFDRNSPATGTYTKTLSPEHKLLDSDILESSLERNQFRGTYNKSTKRDTDLLESSLERNQFRGTHTKCTKKDNDLLESSLERNQFRGTYTKSANKDSDLLESSLERNQFRGTYTKCTKKDNDLLESSLERNQFRGTYTKSANKDSDLLESSLERNQFRGTYTKSTGTNFERNSNSTGTYVKEKFEAISPIQDSSNVLTFERNANASGTYTKRKSEISPTHSSKFEHNTNTSVTYIKEQSQEMPPKHEKSTASAASPSKRKSRPGTYILSGTNSPQNLSSQNSPSHKSSDRSQSPGEKTTDSPQKSPMFTRSLFKRTSNPTSPTKTKDAEDEIRLNSSDSPTSINVKSPTASPTHLNGKPPLQQSNTPSKRHSNTTNPPKSPVRSPTNHPPSTSERLSDSPQQSSPSYSTSPRDSHHQRSSSDSSSTHWSPPIKNAFIFSPTKRRTLERSSSTSEDSVSPTISTSPANSRSPLTKSQSLSNIQILINEEPQSPDKSRLAASQPNLFALKDIRKRLGSNTFSKLGMLKKAMSTSLTKLTQLHAVQKEISLSTETLTDLESEQDITLTSPASSTFNESDIATSSNENLLNASESDSNITNYKTFSHADTLKSMKTIEYDIEITDDLVSDFNDEQSSSEPVSLPSQPDQNVEKITNNNGVVLRQKKGRLAVDESHTSTYVLTNQQKRGTFVIATGESSPKHAMTETLIYTDDPSYTNENESESAIPSDSIQRNSPLRRRTTVDKNQKPRVTARMSNEGSPSDPSGAGYHPSGPSSKSPESSPRRSKRLNKQTTPVHTNFLKRKSNKVSSPNLKLKREEEGDAPLSSRLAALRMKLEEKRRQFEEEKKTKLKEWNEERAQALQSAFFVSMDEKENKDPVNADASGTTTRQESTHGKKSDITPQDYIRQKQLEKQNSPEQQTEKKSWFFDINGQQQDIGKQKHTPNINGEGNAPTAPNPPLSSTIPDEQPSIQSTDQKVTSIRTSYQGVEPSFSQLHQSAVHINWSSYNGTEANFKPESQPTLPTNRASYHGPESSYHKETQYPTNANRSSYTEGMTPTLSALQRLQQTTNELSTHISQNSSSASEQRHQPEQNSNQKMDTIEPTPTLASTTMEAPNIPPQDETPSDIQNTHISNIPESQPLIQQEPETEDPVMEQSQNEIPLPQSEIIVMHQQTETETLNVDPVRPIPFSKEPVPSEMANDMGNLQIQDAINEIASEQPEQSSQQVGEEELGSSSPTKNSALVFTFGGEEETESAGITPEQIKKRERFLQKRQKQIEEKKLKREAELEKKRKKDEEALQEKLKMDEEKERVKKEKIRQRAQSAENHERTPHHHDNQRQHSASAFTVSMNSTSSSPSHQLRRPPSSEHLRRLQSGSPSHHATNGDGTPEESKYLEYTGPSAYQKPSGKSNRKIIQNAITYCCLSGGVNRDAKDKCLEAIEKSEANHFVVLFRDPMKFRGVYEYYPENDLVTKIYGTGPKSITSKMTEKFFRYNSGGKAFNGMLMKDLSIQCDGFTIKKELWEKKPTGGTPSKTPLRKKVR
ncbi:calmodulin-regulated spectrin-associated protein 1-like isoform X1 [Clytia hemisphaerica]|uniref:CKK domain-containing protein n=1 Tax=Clytia hemisphaerica TaxID=252671 RepID=A0A7M5VG31_9CNID